MLHSETGYIVTKLLKPHDSSITMASCIVLHSVTHLNFMSKSMFKVSFIKVLCMYEGSLVIPRKHFPDYVASAVSLSSSINYCKVFILESFFPVLSNPFSQRSCKREWQ